LRRDVDALLVANVANALHCIIPRLFGKHVALCVDGVEWKRGKWGALGKAYFRMNARMCGKILPKGIITDAYAMHKLYLDEFNTPSACIAYGTNPGISTDPEVLRQYGLEPGGYYLVLGRLVPENSADVVVEGFNRTTSKRLLAIVGDANYKSRFVAALKAAAGDRVRFLGRVDNPDHVRELYCNSYAYIHGHTVGGTNPALLHALGYGCCVLAQANPFNDEVLDGHGILFKDAPDLAEKIESIEKNPAIAQDYMRRAPERVREVYSWDRIADQYEEFFFQLANGQDPTQVHSSVHDAERQLTTASI
jgi:glycosyltransferase involved in cell wall biosynthesis